MANVRRRGSVHIGIVVVAVALLVAACGGDGDSVSTDATTTSGPPNIGGKYGGDGNDVLQLQRELNSLNCDAGPNDGTLGPDTEAGIRHFQQVAGLTVDGVVGPQTRAALATAAQTGQPRCPDAPPPPPPSTTPPTTGGGGGTPPCTEAAIRPVVQASLSAGEQMFHLNEFNCAITWAVSTPTVGATEQDAVEITVLLRWNGSAWQVVDRGVYCENGDVPPAIVQKACNSN
jgi:hypothetical protein